MAFRVKLSEETHRSNSKTWAHITNLIIDSHGREGGHVITFTHCLVTGTAQHVTSLVRQAASHVRLSVQMNSGRVLVLVLVVVIITSSFSHQITLTVHAASV